MGRMEYVIAALLVVVRLFLVALVVWFMVREVRKQGRTRRKGT